MNQNRPTFFRKRGTVVISINFIDMRSIIRELVQRHTSIYNKSYYKYFMHQQKFIQDRLYFSAFMNMSKAQELQSSNGYEKISFYKGHPDREVLQTCASALHHASEILMKSPVSDQISSIFYGRAKGSDEFKLCLANFLTKEYGAPVDANNLLLTGGSTMGLHFIASMFFNSFHPFFLEDRTYHCALRTLKHDLPNPITGVTLLDDGIDLKDLEEKVENACKMIMPSARYPWRGLVYMIPVHQNPTGIIYSSERCAKLVDLARRQEILLVADDVYNLLNYTAPPPHRLFSYDDRTDGYGNVISIGSFTKYFSPGLRLGWIETHSDVINAIAKMGLLQSGGSLNHYLSSLFVNVMKTGTLTTHLQNMRAVYGKKLECMLAVLRKDLPPSCRYIEPTGGYFIWITLPKGLSATDFCKFSEDNFNTTVFPGIRCCVNDDTENGIRICFVERKLAEIEIGTKQLCHALTNFINKNTS